MVNSGDASATGDRDDRSVDKMLSEDERRVQDLLAAGLPMYDIGQLLRISETVLQQRVASLLRHYGADDRTSLVAIAYRRGEAPGLGRLVRSVALARNERPPPAQPASLASRGRLQVPAPSRRLAANPAAAKEGRGSLG